MQTSDATQRVQTYLEKSGPWRAVLLALRGLTQASGLAEALKWGKPCYTHNGANVAILYAFKESGAIGFFKGALLEDPTGLLQSPGEHSQAMRMARFTDAQTVADCAPALRTLLRQAIAAEEAGLQITFAEKTALTLPPELTLRLESIPLLRAAFEALTPGRQRGYALYIADAKQTATRAARVEKCIPRILAGKGLADRD